MVASMPVPSWANFRPVSFKTWPTVSYTSSPSITSALLALYLVCATATIPTRSLIQTPFLVVEPLLRRGPMLGTQAARAQKTTKRTLRSPLFASPDSHAPSVVRGYAYVRCPASHHAQRPPLL